ncbi:MAG: hypothetical protein AAGB12_01615 [Pseudomonadota bacterium]
MADKKFTYFENDVLIYEGQHTIQFKSNAYVYKAALKDLEAPPQTEKQLSQFKQVNLFAINRLMKSQL